MKKPIITVMIQARTPERILELMERGISGGADAIGLQLEKLDECFKSEETYRKIFKATHGFPVYVTDYRLEKKPEKDDHDLAKELLSLADFGGDIFDVPTDMFAPCENQVTYNKPAVEKQKELIEKLHAKGKRVLMSSHTGKYMTYDEVKALICEQRLRGADVAKIVSVSKNEREELSAIETSARLAGDGMTDYLFLTSGDFCKTHRRVAPFISGGMFLCVAEYDELATKAQPLLSDVGNLMKLHNEEW